MRSDVNEDVLLLFEPIHQSARQGRIMEGAIVFPDDVRLWNPGEPLRAAGSPKRRNKGQQGGCLTRIVGEAGG